MVIGLIIYETADIIYNISRLSCKALYGVYSWYYSGIDVSGSNNDYLIGISDESNSNNKILLLENKIKKLESQLES